MKDYISQKCTLYDYVVIVSFYLLGAVSLILSIKNFPVKILWEKCLYLSIITILAMFFIDFLTGIVHFLLDYHDLGPLNPYLKKNVKSVEEIDISVRKKASIFQELAFDFQLHHRLPKSILEASFKMMALRIVYILLPIYSAAFLLFQINFLPAIGLFFISQVVLIGSFCHYTHQWAHDNHPNFLVKTLQRCHLAITSQQHETHHKNYLQNFCSFTGWANFLVNYLFQKFYRPYYLKYFYQKQKPIL